MARRGAAVMTCILMASSLVLSEPAEAHAADQQIAFATERDGNSEVYVVTPSEGTPVNITNHGAWDSTPTWSPDGTQIAFVSNRAGNNDIWVMDSDGGNPTNLTASPLDERHPDWSPDGSRIAYAADGIFVIDVEAGSISQLTTPDPTDVSWALDAGDGQPAWSPDGTALAFVRTFQGPTPTAKTAWIYTVPANKSTLPVVTVEGGWWVDGLVWTRDGASLVWSGVSTHHTQARLSQHSLSANTTTALVPPLGFTHFTGPAFSSDGRLLSFVAYTLNTEFPDVYWWQIGSMETHRVTTDPERDADPAWRPTNPSVGLVDTAAGLWTLYQGSARSSFYFGNPGDAPFVGDWDCDGVATPGLYRRSDGFVYLRNSNTAGFADARFFFGNPGDVPLAGDWDGDDCDTISLYRPSDQRFFIINRLGADEGGLGAAEYSFTFGDAGDQPVAGDWDGDGRSEVGLHRASSGLFYWRNSLTTGIADGVIYFGDRGDLFVSGDWGFVDGVDTPAMVRAAAGALFVRHTLVEGIADAVYQLGATATMVPVAGDFDLNP